MTESDVPKFCNLSGQNASRSRRYRPVGSVEWRYFQMRTSGWPNRQSGRSDLSRITAGGSALPLPRSPWLGYSPISRYPPKVGLSHQCDPGPLRVSVGFVFQFPGHGARDTGILPVSPVAPLLRSSVPPTIGKSIRPHWMLVAFSFLLFHCGGRLKMHASAARRQEVIGA